MNNIYLHLGSNMGDKQDNIAKAILAIGKRIGKIVTKSSLYETEAWGIKEQESFINQAVQINSDLSPREMLTKCLAIETEMGRQRKEKWGPRIIDIDILFFGTKKINDKDLVIPHSEIPNRNFVLIPMMEIAGELIHPVLNKSIEEIYDECKDICEVIQIDK
jgi:2-amino-4-hydroxy-6-hydroxymethyldihydropteridine diphosphokinase